LAEGEKPHPAHYRSCRHAKEEMQKKKSQRTPRINVRGIGQGEAKHTKYKRLKLGSGQAYDHSSD
jgi:hypothetical protein